MTTVFTEIQILHLHHNKQWPLWLILPTQTPDRPRFINTINRTVLMCETEGLINSGAGDHIDLTNATSKINLRLDDTHDLISTQHSRRRVAISADFFNDCHPLNSLFSIHPSISCSPFFSSCHSSVQPHHTRRNHTLMKKTYTNQSCVNVDPKAPLKCWHAFYETTV